MLERGRKLFAATARFFFAAQRLDQLPPPIGNEIAFVRLVTPVRLPRRWLGTGTIPYLRLDSLDELIPLLQRQDQTLAYFGFTADEIMLFASRVGGRGIDRIVPVGRALEFSTVWDGYDLLREFTRLVTAS